MPLTPTMLLMPSAGAPLVLGKRIGDDRSRVGEQERGADALHDAEHDQVCRTGATGHPVDGEHERGGRVDDEPEVELPGPMNSPITSRFR